MRKGHGRDHDAWLRLLQDGVSAQSFARRHGVLFDQFAPQLSRLASIGLLEVTDEVYG